MDTWGESLEIGCEDMEYRMQDMHSRILIESASLRVKGIVRDRFIER